MKEQLAALRLIRTDTIGPITFHQLIKRFGLPSVALGNLPDLALRGGRKKKLVIPSESDASQELDAIQKYGATPLFCFEKNYPAYLKMTTDAPPVIYAKGNLDLLTIKMVGMVGARNASATGQKFAQTLAHDLGKNNITVVSGLARGIDTAAHNGSITTGTIAVIGGGFDNLYPKENKKLFEDIVEKGLVLTEYPMGTEPQARHFPARNRIIAGLSLGIVVIEAALQSGSLITARFALEQGRDVFAVPGSPLDPRCKGTNGLIKQGAIVVEDVEDILNNLSASPKPPEPSKDLFSGKPKDGLSDTNTNFTHDSLLQLLSPTPISVDELIRWANVPTSLLLSYMLELEIAGRIQRHPGNQVSLATY